MYLFLDMIANPRYDVFLGILGWIVSVIMASAALFCGIGPDLSVKRGKSILSFAVQFAGVGGIDSIMILFCFFTETFCVPLIKRG